MSTICTKIYCRLCPIHQLTRTSIVGFKKFMNSFSTTSRGL
uniref:Uncharacterized protein n=1 Tax=Arundo donax TaxID=35708 RepID=A0A0A8YBP7_ARUDO